MKWTYVSKHNIKTYESWCNLFFKLSGRAKVLGFSALVLDVSKFDHKKYNEGDSELGFNKILYQFLLHSIGRNYGYYRPIYGYLDHRTTVHTPERLRQMLNAGLQKIHPHKYKDKPFRRLTFRKSKETVLLQMTDILIGAIAFERNLHWTKSDCRPEKISLCQKILEHMHTKPGSWGCKIWDFKFKDR